ncbi:MAG TPA: ankyrin repeat domain-containing protein [Gemmatimonadaceae bacterium]|nr:ankyrin repeat domain-containing protein [Gemmatimonadaceae bacterium]
MTPQLPERPNLEQLKRQAKDLLRAAKARDAVALARFRTLPAFAHQRDDDALAASVALHDAQSVIARELGVPSWNALVARVEELTLELGAAVTQFIEAATEVRAERAARLLALFPAIAHANFHTALVMGDVDAVTARLAEHPAWATEPGGPRNWPPLLYVCHTTLGFGPPARADGLVAIARLLLSLGADPNGRFPWLHHGVRRPVLWSAVCVAHLLPLADALLAAGANPNDGVTLPLAASGGDVASLDVLLSHGADVNQRWATDDSPALYAILAWSDVPEGARWLLDHGADADAEFTPNGETALHAVARRGSADLAADLVRHGANPSRRGRDGRTPYAIAAMVGNQPVAAWLAANGFAGELSEIDGFVAACSRGDRAVAQAMLEQNPALRDAIGAEHYAAFYRAAERGDARVLETMLTCGFDPNHADDEIGKTGLHAAAMGGQPDAIRVLLAHRASVSARDSEFHATPLVWAAEGQRSHGPNGHDYAAVGRLLLDAESPTEWDPGAEPSEEIVDIVREWNRMRDGKGSAR